MVEWSDESHSFIKGNMAVHLEFTKRHLKDSDHEKLNAAERVVPNFHFQMMVTELTETFTAAEMFVCPSPDLCLGTALSLMSTDGSFNFMLGVCALTCTVHCGTFYRQSQDKLNNFELTPVHIVKLPPLHSSSSAGPTAPSSQSPPQPSQVQTPPAASSAQDPGPSCDGNPDSAGALRMDTIPEDTSSDSHLAEDDFTTAGASSSAMKSSFGDLTELNPSTRDRRRLMRQDRIDTKETDC